MALNLGAMIQSARSQKNPSGDYIANFQNQIDRGRSEEQRQFNNAMKVSEIIAQLYGMSGGSSGNANTGKITSMFMGG